MTLSKNGVRKTERVIEGVGEDVSLHPKGGNFVLLGEGVALYGGRYYYLHGYAPQSAVKPEPAPEPEYIFRKGDRVRVTNGDVYAAVPLGTLGTVDEDFTGQDQYVEVIPDDSDEWWMFATNEVEAYTEPEPAAAPTHQHPEGLYESGRTRVIVRHEPEDETYSILYIDNALDGYPKPVNRGMTQVTELGYTLVTEFKA